LLFSFFLSQLGCKGWISSYLAREIRENKADWMDGEDKLDNGSRVSLSFISLSTLSSSYYI
jgi:hypothetical protein